MLYEKITEKPIHVYQFNGFYTGPQGDDVPLFNTVDNVLLDALLRGKIIKSDTHLKIVGLDENSITVPARHYIVIDADGDVSSLTPFQLSNKYRPVHRGQI